MALQLDSEAHAILSGNRGPGAARALRVVADAARLLGANRLIPIASAHIDGCLYHGDAGLAFARLLVDEGARVAVPATTNVGALDLMRPENVRLDGRRREMAQQLMQVHERLGCRPTWTCAPYQAGHRPTFGKDVAWGESNAVAVVNSLLGARSNRYGDFLDLCCAIAGRVPDYGLHRTENRRARMVIDLHHLPEALRRDDCFYPVLGHWYGQAVGETVAVIDGLPATLSEDCLKAFAAAAASSGAVALFHFAGRTPEAPSVPAALGFVPPDAVLRPDLDGLKAARDALTTTVTGTVDAVAVGSPHFSITEFRRLHALLAGRRLRVPFFACTGRHVIGALEKEDLRAPLEQAGVRLVADTCVVVAPILSEIRGVLMTCSAKFAHYGPGNTGYEVVFGSLPDCVESAVHGRVVRDDWLWT